MVSPWALAFPLPFRVQAVVGLGILGWATNIHGLNLLGLDVVGAMDLHTDTAPQSLQLPQHPKTRPSASSLYRAAYRIFIVYTAWCLSCWLLFRFVTAGDPSIVDAYGFIPGLSTLWVLVALVSPFHVLEKQERNKFLLALRRCLFGSPRHPIYFSDVIFADIATSFAKVLGDVWFSLCMLLPGNSMLHVPHATGWARVLAPTVMSLPYFIRFRQCIIEYMLPANDSRRPLFNAIKYATSFPVIYLSAAQRPRGDDSAPWISESSMFHLWIIFALVNSLYSFWWDLTHDWGLSMLAWSSTGNGSRRAGHHAGLRPVLLYPLPVYPLLIFVNLILRLTWSVKLSSHLHIVDRSSTIFILELAEVIRRWTWVFLRVEWEVIKKSGTPGERYRSPVLSEGAFEEEFHLLQRPDSEPRRGGAQFE